MSKKIQNIFIVSSISEDVELLKKYVKNFNANVYDFENANSALNRIDELSPDVILLEFQLDDMTGPDFMVKVSERLLHNPDWQVYLITDKNYTEEEQASMLTLGITHILRKPVDEQTLLKALADY